MNRTKVFEVVLLGDCVTECQAGQSLERRVVRKDASSRRSERGNSKGGNGKIGERVLASQEDGWRQNDGNGKENGTVNGEGGFVVFEEGTNG
jgi:hypothetical protein